MTANEKLAVGLTGGIGSGKSTVANLLAECGASIIDSDAISRALTQAGGAAIAPIREAFGDEYIDVNGALNRAAMRQKIFTDSAAKLTLEAILHPLIHAQMLAKMAEKDAAPYRILVVPLLFENPSFRAMAHQTLMVDCSEGIQVARVTQRDGIDEQTVRRIMAAQMPRDERLKNADYIIQNDSTLADLRKQVDQLHQYFLRK